MIQKSILQKILARLARATIRKYKPIIVGITGSVGKASTREAVFTVLNSKWNTRTSEKNYNNEIGLPLTILGIPHCGKNVFRWCRTLFRAWLRTKIRKLDYPAVLVLEYGIDRPGDMGHLLSIVKPKIAIVTTIGDVPVHVEFFKDPEGLIQEKAKLVQAVLANGHVILNHDDYAVYNMRDCAKARVITYGFEKHADVRITNYELRKTADRKLGEVPEGIVIMVQNDMAICQNRLNELGFLLNQPFRILKKFNVYGNITNCCHNRNFWLYNREKMPHVASTINAVFQNKHCGIIQFSYLGTQPRAKKRTAPP